MLGVMKIGMNVRADGLVTTRVRRIVFALCMAMVLIATATLNTAAGSQGTSRKDGIAPTTAFMTDLYDISLGLTTMLLLVALGWSTSLRRRVKEQTERINLQLRREIELERKYSELFEHANDMVFSLDLMGRFNALNRKGERILGCSRDRSAQATLKQFVAPEQHHAFEEWLEKCTKGAVLPPFELEVIGRDNARSALELSSQLIREGDQVVGVQGIARDITERKRAEAALRQSEERFSSAFRVSPVAIGISSLTDGRYIDVNESFLRLFGFQSHEVIGRTAVELGFWADPEDRVKFEGLLRQRQSVCGAECKLRVKSGATRTTLLFVEPIDLGVVPCALTIVHDMTDRLALEDQLRQATKLEAVGRLAAGVAHDFNNLLTVIQGNAEMALYRNSQNPAMAKALDRISEASKRAANLTRQLLTFSRKQTPQPKPLDLNEVINGATRMFKHLLREDLAVRFKFAPHLPITNVDPTMIEQVIMNLVVNARDAMPKGGELVIGTAHTEIDSAYVKSHAEALAGHYVCLSVSDTGCGMDAETRAKIFEPFFTTKEVGKGTGLGLATVYGIVKQHQGWVEVSSELGKGSTFKIFLPCERPVAIAPEAGNSIAANDPRKTILIVEDELAVAEVARTVLQEDGYRILEASDGLGALQIWNDNRGRIDLLLTDIIMPHGMSGIDLADNLRALKPDLRVIYTTGGSADGLRPEIQSGGCGGFLAKPFSAAHLQQTVRAGFNSPQTAVAA
jgi:two-component system, cell cycle sensor histidine kinase and response regulator CckA